MPLQPDMASMEWLCKPLNLMFNWPGGSMIEIGRYEDFAERRVWDQSIGVRDLATDKLMIGSYEGFRSKCKEWILDQLPEITAEHVSDLVDGFRSGNLVLYPDRLEIFIRNKLDPEGCILVDADDVREQLGDSDYDADGNVTEAAAQRIAEKLNKDDSTFQNVIGE